MKSAEDWITILATANSGRRLRSTPCVEDIQQIQADAIRWAANLTGVLSRITALEKADEIDPPSPKEPL